MAQQNIVLCGFMGSGKTSVGRLLARLTNRKFLDMDRCIEQQRGMSIREIFAQYGEAAFRQMECAVVRELAKEENLVVATGGGTLLNPENAAEFHRRGSAVVLLDAPLAVLRERLKNDTVRPLLQRPDKHAEMERLYRQRIPLYRAAADFSVPAAAPVKRVAQTILRRLAELAPTPLGKTVHVVIDRPQGSRHPEHGFIYPVNYGYVPGVPGGDGEEQDAYLLGVHCPVPSFTGVVAAVIHRRNDCEKKWVVLPPRYRCSPEEIRAATHFQEQYFETDYEFWVGTPEGGRAGVQAP